MKGFELRFNVYAESQQEVDDARKAIVGFIDEHAKSGRAVTAKKLASAISRWKENALVRTQIINYFK